MNDKPMILESVGMQIRNPLLEEIEDTLKVIDKVISHLEKEAEEMGIGVHELKHIDGSYPLHKLLVAKAQLLSTIPMIKTDFILKLPQTISKEEQTRIVNMFRRRKEADG